jgi:hypothetical protein
MKPRILRLSLLLALFSLPSVASAQSSNTFFESSYDYCDAKLLAGFWGESVSDAKATISQKIDLGAEDFVKSALSTARERAIIQETPVCTIYEMGYTYADAEALAAAWSIDVTEAKATMFQKMLHQGEDGLRDALRHAGAPTVAAPAKPATPEAAFAASNFSYCDAKVLAAMWQTSVESAKSSIGHKILGGQESMATAAVGEAFARPDKPACQFYETKYTYSDAEAMAAFWGIDVSETKDRITNKVNFGNAELVDQMLMGYRSGTLEAAP